MKNLLSKIFAPIPSAKPAKSNVRAHLRLLKPLLDTDEYSKINLKDWTLTTWGLFLQQIESRLPANMPHYFDTSEKYTYLPLATICKEAPQFPYRYTIWKRNKKQFQTPSYLIANYFLHCQVYEKYENYYSSTRKSH